MEATVNHAAVYGKDCNGCKRFNKDIMVTFYVPIGENSEKVEYHDYMMTDVQALELIAQISQRIRENAQL